jgi:hypothetical protein
MKMQEADPHACELVERVLDLVANEMKPARPRSEGDLSLQPHQPPATLPASRHYSETTRGDTFWTQCRPPVVKR